MLKIHGTRSTVAFTLFIALGALAGCKGGGSDSAAPAPSAPATTIPSPTPGESTPTSPPSANNRAPTISGMAPASIQAGTAYSFAPQANDPDGDQLTFQITNKPNWAAFNTVTGALNGTPSAAHVRTYGNIVIAVSDGKSTAALPAFSITVTQPAPAATPGTAELTWTAPTENTDGSPLTNLGGFVIVYGKSSQSLDQSVRIDNPSVTSYTFDSLASGKYYFAVKAFNTDGVESDLSAKLSKQIG
jgi:hypothetical protein